MMQLHVSGRLVRDPAAKTSANGKSYITALVAVGAGDKEALVTLMVFDADLQTLLASLKRGDSLSASGAASIRAYADKEGSPAAGVTVMVSRLMTMTAKEAVPRPKGNGQRRRMSDTQIGPPDLPPIEAYNDAIPF